MKRWIVRNHKGRYLNILYSKREEAEEWLSSTIESYLYYIDIIGSIHFHREFYNYMNYDIVEVTLKKGHQ